MHLSHIHLILLPLISFFISIIVASAIPHIPHTPSAISSSYPTPPTPSRLHHFRRRAFAGTRISGLPDGLYGFYADFKTTRPSIPIASVFIRFFRAAASLAAQDPIEGRWKQRFSYGALVLEMIAVEHLGFVSREFVQAASLWLMDAAMHGWTGLFEAYVVDRADGETVYLRLGTIWDLPEKVSNSPWD